MEPPAQDNFFWGSGTWLDLLPVPDEPVPLDLSPGAAALPAPPVDLPVPTHSHDQIESMKNVLILMCTRMDKLETAMGEMTRTNSRVGDVLNQVLEAINQTKDSIERVREGLSDFARTVVHYMKGMLGHEDSE
ncbi:Uu.00g130200.m01.CDS01 [Anthostomella pinea]|uniref:Uu.00g130200.m01.CDS01 n=1 Tax=Anthostomella pinea TaxID=933095 RepID=A0AAI8YI60_9PEZI|nr:Uu.00g130200.m01.CDS01 [Anthostomella pinea]